MPIVLVAGHQRSGTNILRILLNSHPDIAMTNEFANLLEIQRTRVYYSAYIINRLTKIRQKGDLFNLVANEDTPWRDNMVFALKYFLRIQQTFAWRIGSTGVESALHSLLPGKRWVGDKYPDYVWRLGDFSKMSNVKCIAIYRDVRDVVSSSLEKARTSWKGKKFAHVFDAADKVALRWKKSIEIMERSADKILTVKYEDLVSQPQPILDALGRQLQVNPAYFPAHLLHPSSLGKHRNQLSAEQIATVESIAGETMARLGYR
jgi:hypothetical protein